MQNYSFVERCLRVRGDWLSLHQTFLDDASSAVVLARQEEMMKRYFPPSSFRRVRPPPQFQSREEDWGYLVMSDGGVYAIIYMYIDTFLKCTVGFAENNPRNGVYIVFPWDKGDPLLPMFCDVLYSNGSDFIRFLRYTSPGEGAGRFVLNIIREVYEAFHDVPAEIRLFCEGPKEDWRCMSVDRYIGELRDAMRRHYQGCTVRGPEFVNDFATPYLRGSSHEKLHRQRQASMYRMLLKWRTAVPDERMDDQDDAVDSHFVEDDDQDDEVDESENACAICMRHKKKYAFACGHVFCKTCSTRVLQQERCECPTCRTPIAQRTRVRVFL